MSPLSNLDDMDIPPSPGDRRGRVEVSQQKELKDIIDLMPESIDYKKLDKTKIMITLGESLEGEGGKFVAVFYTIRPDVPDNAKLKAVDLGVSFAECQQLSKQR